MHPHAPARSPITLRRAFLAAFAALLLTALIGASSAAAATGPALSTSCQANNVNDPLQVTCTFTGAGDYALPVGPNASQATVDAVGAAGGSPTWIDGSTMSVGGTGGHGSEVSGNISFTSGTDTLYVLVGRGSREYLLGHGESAGGDNGGGAQGLTSYSGFYNGSYIAGVGGGASDVRTTDAGQSGSLASRLIVAGGGGGAGVEGTSGGGGGGGDAGQAGQPGGGGGNAGGGAGTQSAGGGGGATGNGGGGGALGQGGNGGSDSGNGAYVAGAGGGGGGGYYGGGGGGGSNLVPSGGTASVSSAPARVTVTYERAASTTSVSASPNSGDVYGSSVTLTATVRSATGTPDGGTVTFYDNGTAIGSAQTVDSATGQATLTTAALAGGAHSITAAYAGDAGYTASDSSASPLSYTVAADTTQTAVSVDTPDSYYDYPATVTATVTATSGASVSGGTVQFYDGQSALGGPVAVSGGQASLNLKGLLSAADHQLSASYSGDASTGPSESGQVTETVMLEPTDIFMYPSSGAYTYSYGQSIQFTASFGPDGYNLQNYLLSHLGTATDSIQLYDGSTPVGTAQLLTFWEVASSITLTATTPAAGTHSYHVVYGGDAAYASSDSGQYYQPTTTVNNVPSATTVTSTLGANSTLGQAPTLTATVTRADGVTPVGTVQFTDNGQSLGSPVTLDGTGAATLAPGPLPLGTNAIGAAYTPGDPYTQSDSSQNLAQTVNRLSTATTVTSSPRAIEGGDAVTLTASIAVQGAPASGPGREAAGGTVSFSDGQTALGTAQLGADGSASLQIPAGLSVGAHVITASYGGDTDHAPSVTSPTAVVIHRNDTQLSLAFSQPDAQNGLTLTASLSPLDTNSGLVPGGSVEFYDGATLLGTSTLSGGNATAPGTATLHAPGLGTGAHALQAVYSGDAQFRGSSSSPQSLNVVEPDPTPTPTPNPPTPTPTPNPPTPAPVAQPHSGRVEIVSERRPLDGDTLRVRLYCGGGRSLRCAGELRVNSGPSSAYELTGGRLAWVTVTVRSALKAHVAAHGSTHVIATAVPRKLSADQRAPRRVRKWVFLVRGEASMTMISVSTKG